jgi:plastocyanin
VARVLRLAVASLLLGLAAAGCSGGSGGASAVAPVATTTVDLPPSYRFAPAAISVAAGATVTWTNHDHFSHSVAFLDGGLPSQPMEMKPGAAVTFTFATAGAYRYQCSLHPQNMQGTVVVTP